MDKITIDNSVFLNRISNPMKPNNSLMYKGTFKLKDFPEDQSFFLILFESA